MPKFSTEDNIIMLIKLSAELIKSNKLVAFFVSAPKTSVGYSFKDKFRYKILDGVLYAKAKSRQLMLFKETGVIIDRKKLKTAVLQFKKCIIEVFPQKNSKKSTFLQKFLGSFGNTSKIDANKVSALDNACEFDGEELLHKFNRTTFIGNKL